MQTFQFNEESQVHTLCELDFLSLNWKVHWTESSAWQPSWTKSSVQKHDQSLTCLLFSSSSLTESVTSLSIKESSLTISNELPELRHSLGFHRWYKSCSQLHLNSCSTTSTWKQTNNSTTTRHLNTYKVCIYRLHNLLTRIGKIVYCNTFHSFVGPYSCLYSGIVIATNQEAAKQNKKTTEYSHTFIHHLWSKVLTCSPGLWRGTMLNELSCTFPKFRSFCLWPWVSITLCQNKIYKRTILLGCPQSGVFRRKCMQVSFVPLLTQTIVSRVDEECSRSGNHEDVSQPW